MSLHVQVVCVNNFGVSIFTLFTFVIIKTMIAFLIIVHKKILFSLLYVIDKNILTLKLFLSTVILNVG